MLWHFRIIHFIFVTIFPVYVSVCGCTYPIFITLRLFHTHKFGCVRACDARMRTTERLYTQTHKMRHALNEWIEFTDPKRAAARVNEKMEVKKKWQPMSSIFCLCLDRIYITLTRARHKLDHTNQLTRWLTVVIAVATVFCSSLFLSPSSYVVVFTIEFQLHEIIFSFGHFTTINRWPNTQWIMYLIWSVMLNEAKNTHIHKHTQKKKQKLAAAEAAASSSTSNLTDETRPDWMPWHLCYIVKWRIYRTKVPVWFSLALSVSYSGIMSKNSTIELLTYALCVNIFSHVSKWKQNDDLSLDDNVVCETECSLRC